MSTQSVCPYFFDAPLPIYDEIFIIFLNKLIIFKEDCKFNKNYLQFVIFTY